MQTEDLIKQCKTDADMALIFIKYALDGKLSVKDLKKWIGALGYELNQIAEEYILNYLNSSNILSAQKKEEEINLIN